MPAGGRAGGMIWRDYTESRRIGQYADDDGRVCFIPYAVLSVPLKVDCIEDSAPHTG